MICLRTLITILVVVFLISSFNSGLVLAVSTTGKIVFQDNFENGSLLTWSQGVTTGGTMVLGGDVGDKYVTFSYTNPSGYVQLIKNVPLLNE